MEKPKNGKKSHRSKKWHRAVVKKQKSHGVEPGAHDCHLNISEHKLVRENTTKKKKERSHGKNKKKLKEAKSSIVLWSKSKNA